MSGYSSGQLSGYWRMFAFFLVIMSYFFLRRFPKIFILLLILQIQLDVKLKLILQINKPKMLRSLKSRSDKNDGQQAWQPMNTIARGQINQISLVRGVLISDRQTDICDSRVAFATEKLYFSLSLLQRG